MKKIGGGWQYSVYDMGSSRVLKKPASRAQQYWQIFWWTCLKKPFWQILERARRVQLHAESSLCNLQPLLPKVALFLGNPVIHKDYSYEQDKATPLEKYFKEHTFEENIKIIDKYAEVYLLLWSYGFNDQPFKPCRNFGVTHDGRVILLDLGELYFTKEKAKERIQSRHWRSAFFLSWKLKQYYVEKMDSIVTLQNLEKYWRKSIDVE